MLINSVKKNILLDGAITAITAKVVTLSAMQRVIGLYTVYLAYLSSYHRPLSMHRPPEGVTYGIIFSREKCLVSLSMTQT